MSSSTLVCEVACEPALVVAAERSTTWNRVRDYVELTKPRIALLELVVVATAAFVARWHALEPWTLVHALLGTTLVAGSASAWNQWLELERDGRMRRTSERPLPGGRLSRSEVAWFGTVTGLAGLVYLAWLVNPLTAVLGGISWLIYVVIYTPLKSRTTWNTAIGALAGGLPMLMGWTASGRPLSLAAWILFAILFLWQFPHFMAIAWLYRRDYAAAGLQMLSVVDPSGRRAGLQAVSAALILLPLSLLPSVVTFAGPWYFGGALILGLAQLAAAIYFCHARTEHSARWLLRGSLVYLPALLFLLIIGPLA